MKINNEQLNPDDEKSSIPPALPPKKNRPAAEKPKERIVPILRESDGSVIVSQLRPPSSRGSSRPTSSSSSPATVNSKRFSSDSNASISTSVSSSSEVKPKTELEPQPQQQQQQQQPEENSVPEDSPLNRLQLSPQSSLLYANNAEGLIELRAGELDELVVLACGCSPTSRLQQQQQQQQQQQHNGGRDFVYQDAFLVTYRTFISSLELLTKLQHRFRRFNDNPDDPVRLKEARGAFSLLVRIVDSLMDCDLADKEVVASLTSFMAELIENGDLLLARALRTKFSQKYEQYKTRMLPDLDFGRLKVKGKFTPRLIRFR